MKHRICSTLLLVILTFSGLYAQQTFAYVERDSTFYLDVYQPATTPNGYTVVHIFGGGFIMGSRQRQWDVDYCRMLTERGYTAVAIDYRLGLKGQYKVGVSNIGVLENAFYMAAEDCSAAVAYLVKHAAELNIDPDKIILCGSSAGAITALMTDYGRCNTLPYVAELPEGWKPAGIIAYSGAIYSTLRGLKWAMPPAPTMLFHGTEDKLVMYKKMEVGKRGMYGSDAIARQLDKNNHHYCIYRYKGLGHEVSMGGPRTLEELDLFVSQYIEQGRALHSDITIRDDSIQPTIFTHMTVRDVYKKKVLSDL
ncbi:MAG: alpha/beta hydrolase [Paludibacteraceae bacterium]|nr:alpha/beta hydrolase [Paludibacteraceae bacterium]